MMGGDELTEVGQDDALTGDDEPPFECDEFDMPESVSLGDGAFSS